MAKFKVLFNPLRVSLEMNTISSQLVQEYNVDNKTFTPDRRIVPTVVQPVVRTIDPAGLVADEVKNKELPPEYIKWFENERKSEFEILESNSSYKIDRTSTNNNRGRITVRKNTENPITLHFEAIYIDKVGAKVRRRAAVQGSVTLTTNIAAKAPLVLKEGYPRGHIFNPMKEFEHMKLSADLYAGQKIIPSAYWWYKKNGAVETLLGETYEGHNLSEVKIPSAEIGKEQRYLVKVQDCRGELAQVQDDYFEANYDASLGRNYYHSRSPATYSAGGGFVTRPFEETVRGFYSLGSASDLMKGNVRIGNVISGNGRWVLKFRAKANGSVSMYVDVCDGPLQVVYLTNSWRDFELVFDVASWEKDVYNFADFGNLSYAYYWIDDLMICKEGEVGLPWVVAPEDVRREAEDITLGIGYRPTPNPSKQKTAELTLATQYPKYTTRVVSDFGTADDGTIEIPSGVTSFDVWVEFRTAQGVLANPEKYFNVDWGAGRTGIRQTFNTADLGIEEVNIDPAITEKF